MTGEEISNMEKSDGGRERLEAAVRARYFSEPLQLVVRAKLDSYNGEPRPNVSCIDACAVNYAEHWREMLKNIHAMLAA